MLAFGETGVVVFLLDFIKSYVLRADGSTPTRDTPVGVALHIGFVSRSDHEREPWRAAAVIKGQFSI